MTCRRGPGGPSHVPLEGNQKSPGRPNARLIVMIRRDPTVRLPFALAVGLVAISVAPAFAKPCAAGPGGIVILSSDALDPDVFLWDSRDRLVNYTEGQWGNTRTIFAHTILAQPGTRATVVACYPSATRTKYSNVERDAIGVKIMSGPYRGHYGWVLSSDIHLPKKN